MSRYWEWDWEPPKKRRKKIKDVVKFVPELKIKSVFNGIIEIEFVNSDLFGKYESSHCWEFEIMYNKDSFLM